MSERNLDKPSAPTNAQSEDSFADARMGNVVKVALTTPAGLPSCDDIVRSIQQMGANNQEMMHKMDNFAHTNFGSRGVTLADLQGMQRDSHFTPQEKKVLGYMVNGFAQHAGDKGDPSRMNVQEFLNYLIKSATDQACNFPGMGTPSQNNGGMRRKG